MSVCHRSPASRARSAVAGLACACAWPGSTPRQPLGLADPPHARHAHAHAREARQEVPHLLQPEVGEPPLDGHHLLAHRRGERRPAPALGRARGHPLEPLRALRPCLRSQLPSVTALMPHCAANAFCVSPAFWYASTAWRRSSGEYRFPPRQVPGGRRVAVPLTLLAGRGRPFDFLAPIAVPSAATARAHRAPAPPAEEEVIFRHPTRPRKRHARSRNPNENRADMREGLGFLESGKPVRSRWREPRRPSARASSQAEDLTGTPLSGPTPWDTEPEEMTGGPCSLPRA